MSIAIDCTIQSLHQLSLKSEQAGYEGTILVIASEKLSYSCNFSPQQRLAQKIAQNFQQISTLDRQNNKLLSYAFVLRLGMNFISFIVTFTTF